MEIVIQQDTTEIKPISDSVVDTMLNNTDTLQADTVVKPQPPTWEQIRYWRWQREKKMLIGDSRYIKPKNEVKLTSSLEVKDGIGLPVQPKTSSNTDWLTIILIGVLIIFASIRITYGKYLKHLFQSVFNYSTASRMFNEKNYNIFHAAYRLELFFYIIIAVFVFQLTDYLQLELNYKNWLLYIICFGFTLSYFVIKKIIYRMLGLLFKTSEDTAEYLFNMDNYNKVTGLLLLPFVSLVAYNPFESVDFTVYSAIILFSLIYIFMLRRGFLILLKKQYPIYYLFLYLCTLEFLPLLLIYKVVVM